LSVLFQDIEDVEVMDYFLSGEIVIGDYGMREQLQMKLKEEFH